MRLPAETTHALLAKYHIHKPVTDERFLHHADVTRGVPLSIICLTDPYAGKQIIVSSNRKRCVQACPLSLQHAEMLVGELGDQGIFSSTPAEREMLAHLLLRCSELFVHEGLQRFYLAPVYVRPNDYRIGHASMSSGSRISIEQRLDPHAHDKGAVFA